VTKNELNAIDDGLVNLFASFDEVKASDQLKEATLAKIFDQAEAVGNPRSVRIQPKTPFRLRKAWLVAAAACLALALTGGAAWAIPSAHVQVSGDKSNLDLGINIFGIAVSTASDDAELLARAQNADVQNKPVEEALDKAFALIYECEPDADIDASAHANIPHQQEQLASDAAAAHERFEIAHPQPIAPENHKEASPSALRGNSEDGTPVMPNENAVANAADTHSVSTAPTIPDSLDAAPKPGEDESSKSPDYHESPDGEDIANKSAKFGEHNGQAASDEAFATDSEASPPYNADDTPRGENAIGGAPPESNGFISPPNTESPNMAPPEQ